MKRNLKDYGLLVLKGMGMGAADVVPGVSGGTIAFIVGIYEELIDSIKSINGASLKLLFTGKIAAFWKAINANFLLSIIAGIGISIFSLAKIITWLLTDHPILVWSFFFGLVLASTWFVSKDIKKWDWKTILSYIIGIVIAFYITVATPAETPSNLFFIFLCGAIAICAMILPGISGSFILVLLGKYFYIMEAVKTFNIPVMLVFICNRYHQFLPCTFVRSPPVPRHYDLRIGRFYARFAKQGLALEGNDRDLYRQSWRCKAFSRSQHHAKSTCLGSCRPDGFRLRHRLLLGKALDENIEIINYNKKRGSAASFFAVEPLFYSHSTPPYHKVVYTNASTA